MARLALALEMTYADIHARATGESRMALRNSALCREFPTHFHRQKRPYHQRVNVGAHEAIHRLRGRVHDGFVFVEACVQNHRRPRVFTKGFDQVVVSGVLLPRNGVQTTGEIFVADRGEGGTVSPA